MSDHLDDQIDAAQAETRNMMKTSLGSAGPTRGTSPVIAELLERFPRSVRCAHLRSAPVQPWMLPLPDATWRCRACMIEYSLNASPVSAIEDHTCDFCRRHLPGQGATFTPIVFRQDTWVIMGGACAECAADFEAAGAGPAT